MKHFLLFSSLLCAAAPVMAEKVVLEDFESYEVGQKLQMFNVWGNAPASSCTVERDPANANNKVLHIYGKQWGEFYGVTLPEHLSGTALLQEEDMVSFRLYRPSSDSDYKKVQVYQGSVLLYEDDGYPQQGNQNTWQSRTYYFNKSASSTGKVLAVGFNHDKSDYYIDDIVIKGKYDDYKKVDNDTIDISGQNTASSYATYTAPLNVAEGRQVTFLTSRYTYLHSAVAGKGTVNICSGGERTYLGNASKAFPDWSGFTGKVILSPYKKLSGSNGFYGLVLMHNGKTMTTPESAQEEAKTGRMNNCMAHASLVMRDGSTLAIEGSSNNRGAAIGHLEMEEGSRLMGYYKKSVSHAYYLIGGTGDDATLAGTIATVENYTGHNLGLIKEGKGTYRITGNRNLITGGVRVMEGRVLFNNDAEKAREGKLTGSTGTLPTATDIGVIVNQEATIGGTGHIAASTNLYGSLEPGDDGTGLLTFADYAGGKKLKLIVRPRSRILCDIASSTDYDQLVVEGAISYYNIGQDFSASADMPQLHIQLDPDASLMVGDEFVLLKASTKESYKDVEWQFDVRYPKAYTWKVEQKEVDGSWCVVARVISLAYTGQGDVTDDKDKEDEMDWNAVVCDFQAEQKEASTLRSYADAKNLYVGSCAPVWRMSLGDESNVRTQILGRQFNAIVAENEMKFDATEPNQNEFSLGSGDELVNFAEKHKMYVRGHALAWHSQVPGWLTSDGKKNSYNRTRADLLAILKNHIFTVVGHWKGRIHEWDVANEVLDDTQTSIQSDPNAYDLRPSVWATGIGEDFLDSAFVWAHQADPEAILILNDYDVEGKGWAKSEALHNLVTRLRNSGIPVHGVGLQCHLDAGMDCIGAIDRNVARYQQEGLLCRITELDLGISASTDELLAQQGNDFYRLAKIAMKYDNCGMLMIWGLTDDMTWRTGRRPLLYNENCQTKPAYWGVHAALREAGTADALESIQSPVESLSSFPCYNLQGQLVRSPQSGLLYVQGNRRIVLK